MRVVITGGGGFLGHQLCEWLIRVGRLSGPDSQPRAIEKIVLLDGFFSKPLPASTPSIDIEKVVGSIESQEVLDAAIGSGSQVSIFHLASMVSGECEERFDDALKVNLQGGLRLLESARRVGPCCRLVFASSIACFGGPALQDPCDDWTKLTPQTTYGMTKAMVELLVSDYARKGFVDGRSARLPTVIIRPGKPNMAASSWASGMFREPLCGVDCPLPVHMDQRHPMTGYRTVIESLIAIHDLPAAKIGRDRAIGLPAMSVTPAMAQAALVQATTGEAAVRLPKGLGRILLAPDQRIQGIVDQWPVAVDGSRALSLGLPSPPSLVEIIRGFVEDFLPTS
ncbi:MAG: NAD-dependent epimerase/dehydratase family protein [Pirellula sp.]